MTVNTGITEGSGGYVGVMTESVPGGTGTKGTFVPATSDHFLPITAPPTLASKYDVDKAMVALNSPDTNRQQRNTKAKVAGGLQWGLQFDAGIELIIAAVGNDAYQSAITADTAASITTAVGISTIVLTAGTGAFQPYQLLTVDTGVNQEITVVLSWTLGSKTLTVPALAKTHGATPPVVGMGCHKTAPISSSGGLGNLRRTVSVEEAVGNSYSEQYPAGYVDKLMFKGAKSSIACTADLMFDAQRVRPGSPTAFAQTALTDTNVKHPYTFNDGYLVIGADQGATGTSTQQQVLLAEDYDCSIQNKTTQKALYDQLDYYRVFPGGERLVDANFSIINTANRPAIWEDFVRSNVEAAFVAFHAQNIGTATTPVWRAFVIAIPNLHYDDSEPIRVFADPIGEKVKATARADGVHDVIQIWYVNSSITSL